MKVKVLALLLASVFLFSACGTEGETPATTDPTSGQDSQHESGTEPTPIHMFITIGPEFNPETFPTVAFLEEKLNIKLEYEIPPSSSYDEKLQIVLSSGDYPDVMLFPNHAGKAFVDAVKNDVILPITEQVKKAENLQKYTNEMSWDAMKTLGDDEIYGIPRTTPYRADGFMIRKDWCKNLGIELPENNTVTLDEFNEIMRKMTFDDPDGNGKADTYGYTFSTDADGNFGPVFGNAFALSGWKEFEGEDYKYLDMRHAKNDDTFKRLLEYNVGLWKEGITDPVAPTIKTNEDRIDRFKQGSVATLGDFGGNAFSYLQDMQPMQPDATLGYLFIENEKNVVEGDAFGLGYWWLSAITVSAKGKEDKIVEFYDYMLSDEGWTALKYGPEGVTWSETNGERVMNEEEYAKMAQTRSHFALVRRNDDASFFFDPLLGKEEVAEAEKWVTTALDTAVPSLDRGYRPPTADNPVFIDYNKLLDNAITKIILGNEPVEYYDTALAEWYANGGEEYVKEMNEYIESMESK